MENTKYILTDVSKEVLGVKLFQIKALVAFGNVSKDELGGWIEKEGNLSQDGDAWVYGDARVYGDAMVYGNAWVSAKLSYTKGKFVGGDDSETPKFTNVTNKMGNTNWKNQYVIGDYEISEIEETKEVKTEEIIELNGKKYKLIN